MFPIKVSAIGEDESPKKRRHPDGKHLSSSLSKRQHPLHEAEVDSAVHSNDDTVTCSHLHDKVPDQLSCRTDALDTESSVSSFPAAVLSSVDSCGDRAIREHQQSFHGKKSKGSWLNNPLKGSTFDADVEVSGVTFENCDNVDSPAGSACSDYVPRGASGLSNIMCRDEGWQRVRDDTGPSCEEPIADMLLDHKSVQHTNLDACRPGQSLTSGVETEMQCAVFSDARRKLSDETRVEMPNSNELGKDSLEIRSSDSSRIEVLQGEGIARSWMGQTRNRGHDCVEDACQTHVNEQQIDDEPRPSYVHSSGRLSLEEEAQLGRRAPTIDHAFEEYFSTLML